MTSLLGGDDDAAHERVASSAQPGALELVAARSGLECGGRNTASPFGQLEIDVSAHDMKAVHRVFAGQADFELCSCFDSNLRRVEAETLGADLDDLRFVGCVGFAEAGPCV